MVVDKLLSLDFCKGLVFCLFNALTCFLVSCVCLCVFFSVGALPPRVYVGHSIYKGKSALTVTPRPPEFAPLDVWLLFILV